MSSDTSVSVTKKFFGMAIPATVGLMVAYLLTTVNLIFVGQLDDANKLAACGLGNQIILIFGQAAFYGLNSGMETLVSQAFGKKNLTQCGYYYQRGRLLVLLYCIPLLMIFSIQGWFLRLLGQNPEIVSISQTYLLCMAPAAFMNGQNDLQNKFLIQLGKSKLLVPTQIMALGLHVCLCYLFVCYLNLDIYGTTMATFMTQSFIYLVNRTKLHSQTDIKEVASISLLDENVCKDFKEYLKIGIPNMFTFLLELSSFEIMILVTGYIGVTQQASQIILLNFYGIPGMIAFAYQQVACALVGQQIGANDVKQAKAVYHKILVIVSLSLSFLWGLLFWNRFTIVTFFTSELEIQQMTNYIVWLVIICVSESFFKNSLLGVIKALELQGIAFKINLVSYWVLALPISLLCAFKLQKYGLFVDPTSETNNRGLGIWMGFLIGIGFQCVGYFYLLMITDFQKVCDKSQDRYNASIIDDQSFNSALVKTMDSSDSNDQNNSSDNVLKDEILGSKDYV